MIRVAHVVGSMNRGGAEVMLMDIFRNISKDIQFDFIVNYKQNDGVPTGDFDEEILLKGGRIRYIVSQHDIGFRNYISAFKEIIRELGNPHIAHIHMNARSGIIACAAKKAGVKSVIVHSHADLKFRGGVLSKFISTTELIIQKKLISFFADRFWSCSHEAGLSLFYKRDFKSENSAIINNAIDLSYYGAIGKIESDILRAQYGCSPETVVFGNIGRIVRHKNIGFIVDLLVEYKKINSDFLFVIAGRVDDVEYYEEIVSKAEHFGIREKVIHLGLRDDIPLVMHSFDVFLGPALQEGFGMVAVEAQAAGVPCILYKGFPEKVDMNLGLVSFLSSFETAEWIDAIKGINSKSVSRDKIESSIVSCGYCIRSSVCSIEGSYRELVRNKKLKN